VFKSFNIPEDMPITKIHLWYHNNDGVPLGITEPIVEKGDNKKNLHYLRGIEFMTLNDCNIEQSLVEIGTTEGLIKTYKMPEKA
jgi:hypothetical protein